MASACRGLQCLRWLAFFCSFVLPHKNHGFVFAFIFLNDIDRDRWQPMPKHTQNSRAKVIKVVLKITLLLFFCVRFSAYLDCQTFVRVRLIESAS